MTGDAEWTLLIASDLSDIDHIISRFKATHAQVSRNRPTALPELDYEIRGCFAAATHLESIADAASESTCLV